MNRSPWIQAASGGKVHPLNLDPRSVRLEDIAHSLGHICRFNGHCRVHYSVAEHSVRLSYQVPKEDALAGLMHDAGEYVMGDITRPIKGQLAVWCPDRRWYVPIKEVEQKAHRAICHALQMPHAIPDSVHEADLRMVKTEARDLLGPAPELWDIAAEPYAFTIVPWAPETAGFRFLLRYREITEGEA